MQPPDSLRIGLRSDAPNRTSETDSYERTNERTETIGYDPCKSDSPERARAYNSPEGFASIGDVIAAGQLWRTETRHPRVRTGERDPIPLYVRLAIWYRDGGKCSDCEPWRHSQAMHLDHIKPWSAGGTDTSDNLRLLCKRHNTDRSNFVDYARPKRPVTWWCHRCHVPGYWLGPQGWMTCPRHRQYGPNPRCRAARASLRWEDATWFDRPIPEDFPHIAYCAHCNAPGMTGVLL